MLIFGLVIFLIGLSLGSFANVLVWRLATKRSILGRSICPQCNKQIAWYDNLPIISFIFLGGHCRFCRQKISWQYPLVELSIAILWLIAWFKAFDYQLVSLVDLWPTLVNSGVIWMLLRDWLAGFLLVFILVFDWRFLLIPINLLVIFAPIFWLFNVLIGQIWWQPLLSAGILAIFFGLQFVITKGKGLGEGDIWLGAFLGFLLSSWPAVLAAVFVAYLLGSLVGLILMLIKKKHWHSRLPLGTFLAFGAILAIFWAEIIWSAYFNLFDFLV